MLLSVLTGVLPARCWVAAGLLCPAGEACSRNLLLQLPVENLLQVSSCMVLNSALTLFCLTSGLCFRLPLSVPAGATSGEAQPWPRAVGIVPAAASPRRHAGGTSSPQTRAALPKGVWRHRTTAFQARGHAGLGFELSCLGALTKSPEAVVPA